MSILSENDIEAKAWLIESLVKHVLNELAKTPVGLDTYIVLLDSRIEKLMSLLEVRSNGIRVLRLYRMVGVGKTTLAKDLCNKLVSHFQWLIFITKVSKNSAKEVDLVSLRDKLIHDLSSGKSSVYFVTAIKEAL